MKRHVGNRRVANYYFLLTKLVPASPDSTADETDLLALLLQTIMTPEARNRFGISGQDSTFADNITLHAALDGLGKARGCRMHFTSSKKEGNLLRSAYRRIRERNLLRSASGNPLQDNEPFESTAKAEEDDRQCASRSFSREPWHFALRDLLHLTCRFWTYIRLFLHRDTHLWKGPLNQLLWDSPRQQSALTPPIKYMARLEAELTEALMLIHEGEKPDDPASVFLRRLDKAAADAPLAYGDWERRPEWLNHVLDALPDSLPPASGDRQLVPALGRLGVLRDQLGKTMLGQAWSELGRELVQPRVQPPEQSPPKSIHAVLDFDYHSGRHHVHERPPADILRAILSHPLEAAVPSALQNTAAQSFDATRLLLIEYLTAVVPDHSPEASVLTHALSNTKVSFDMLRDTLLQHPPETLSVDLLSEAKARLEQWRTAYRSLQAKLRSWTQNAAPPESYELLDLAEDAWDEGKLSEAIEIVSHWNTKSAASRDGSPQSAAVAIRSAVLSICLDRLWEDMNDFFVAFRDLLPPAAGLGP